jgi:hypothetical protein
MVGAEYNRKIYSYVMHLSARVTRLNTIHR